MAGARLNVRFDAAFGLGSPQLYLSLTEAF
jgi:hypothetical protein